MSRADTDAAAAAPPAVIAALDRASSRLVEAAAAALVLAEVMILLVGVIARFFFNYPLTWTDELATTLFVWLAMLGAVVALQRGQHMRLTAVVARLSPPAQALLQAFAACAAILFLGLMVWPSLQYAREEDAIATPALGWSNVVRGAAIPAGIIMMLLTQLFRLAQYRPRPVLIAGGALALITLLLAVFADGITAMGHANLIIFFAVFIFAGVLLGVPIAFAFGLSTIAYVATVTDAPLMVMAIRMDEGIGSLILLAVPLFIFLGALIEMTGMARAMLTFLASLLGHVRGGLNYVLLGAMYLISGISGSKAADMAAVAPILFPEMKRRGGDEGEMVSLLSASGAMSETIPPSIVLITIGSVAGVSIAALFTGGLLPALVLAVALGVVAWFRARGEDLAGVRPASRQVIVKALVTALPALFLPFAIRTVVVEGVATATEVSTLGILYSVVAGLAIYRIFDWKRLFPMLVETAALSGAILVIIAAASCMAWALTVSGLSRDIFLAMSSLPGGAAGFMAASIVAFIVLGSVLEGIPAIVLFAPLLFPVARALQINDVHYAIVVILAMGIGLFAPPFGVGYYAACAVGKVNPDAGMRKIWAYIAALAVGLIVVAIFPWISTGFLPRR